MRSALRLTSVILVATSAATTPGCQNEPHRVRDTGEIPVCAEGWLADRFACVPESCGTGTWGNLEAGEGTVYVDIDAADAGDGSEGAPLRSIQAGLNLAGSRGGGLVAVAAGTYPETLELTSDHAGVHLAGRCRELVTVDASSGDDQTPGIEVDAGYTSVGIAGVTVRGSNHTGLKMGSGEVEVRGARVVDSAFVGVEAEQSYSAPTTLTLESCELEGNVAAGILAKDPNTVVSLHDTVIRGTRSLADGRSGYGIDTYGGASVSVTSCVLADNAAVGVLAFQAGTSISLTDTIVRGTRPNDDGQHGFGLQVSEGAQLQAEGCIVEENEVVGVLVKSEGTEATLTGTVVRDTRPGDQDGCGFGIQVQGDAALAMDDCIIEGNTSLGISAAGSDTQLTLTSCIIRDTLPSDDEGAGHGIEALDGVSLTAEDCVVQGNTSVGIVAEDPTTTIRLAGTRILDTLPDHGGERGYGIAVSGGATLVAEACALERNTSVGVSVFDSGTEVWLEGTTISDTRAGVMSIGDGGYGLQAAEGASLSATGCLVDQSHAIGIVAAGADTTVTLTRTVIQDTAPTGSGELGYGAEVWGGASLVAVDCLLQRNQGVGLLAFDPHTTVKLHGTTITGTSLGADLDNGAVAAGAVAQEGAFIEATQLEVSSNEGLGLYTLHKGSSISCNDCSLLDNQFAGAGLIDGATLAIADSWIEGTSQSANLGGGVGVWAEPWFGGDTVTLSIRDSTIPDNAVAGVRLAGEGSYQLSGNTITGGAGLAHGSTTRCGDGVYAVGTTAWDGTSGLYLGSNTLADNTGAGLFLDNAAAMLDGNVWSGNDPDLLVQGDSCLSPRADYSEAPTSEICPEWDRPVCELLFTLNLAVADIVPARLSPPPLHPALASPSTPISRPVLREDAGGGDQLQWREW